MRRSSSGSNIATYRSSNNNNTSNSDSDEQEEDAKNRSKLFRSSIIQSVISEARSIVANEELIRPSISRPSRPYTPRDCERRLFIENEYSSRPTSAVSISSTFDFSHRNLSSSSGARDDTNQQEPSRSGSGSRKKKPSSSSSKRTGSSKSSRSDLDNKEDNQSEQGTSDKVWHSVDSILGSLEQCEDEDTLMDSLDSILLLIDKLIQVPNNNHSAAEDEKKINFVGKLSKFIDIENGPRTVKCCAIILRVSTLGVQILHICKILFKISKQEKNDKVFKDDTIIAPLVKLLHQEFTSENYNVSWEILLFTIGTLKNISYDNYNQKLLVKHNTISLLSLLLSSALRELKTGSIEKVNKQAQLLVQIMATLRNLAMKSGTFKHFLEYNVIDNIHILMNALLSHSEFIHNSTRVLSKLSLDEMCTEEMRTISTLKSCLINVLKEHKKHKPIVVRVTFILGNITFQDYTKQELFDEKTEIPFLLDLLDLYSIEDERNSGAENVKKETEDLLTKLIRLIANISMDERQGKIIAKSKHVTRLIEIVERKKVQDAEELILNTLRCITNLSFYAFNNTASPLYTFRVKLASLLSPLLFHDLTDVVYEATRTFGNLSQDSSVREYITKSRIDEALVIMVEHGNTDIAYAVCGVLVNITSDPKGIRAIQEQGAIEKLLDVLEKCNVSLALVILKIIHNICLNNEVGENSKIYSDYDLEHLDMLLNDILNHEYNHEEMNEQEVSMLRDLSSVAQELQYILSK